MSFLNMASSRKTTVVNIQGEDGQLVDFDIYIGRRVHKFLPDSVWRNIISKEECPNNAQRVLKFNEYFYQNKFLQNSLSQLVGKRLGCLCSPEPCHGDILAELANKYAEEFCKQVEEKTGTVHVGCLSITDFVELKEKALKKVFSEGPKETLGKLRN